MQAHVQERIGSSVAAVEVLRERLRCQHEGLIFRVQRHHIGDALLLRVQRQAVQTALPRLGIGAAQAIPVLAEHQAACAVPAAATAAALSGHSHRSAIRHCPQRGRRAVQV